MAVPATNWPAAQAVHATAPAAGAYQPALQAVQLGEPLPAANQPLEQGVQSLEPATENLPTAQAWPHTVDAAAPTAVLYWPAAHPEQVAWPVLGSYMPAPQLVQLDAPSYTNDEYEP